VHCRHARCRHGRGRAALAGQRKEVIIEGSTTRGVVTLYEGGGRRVLRGQGSFVGSTARACSK
jgi:hypothetical protein